MKSHKTYIESYLSISWACSGMFVSLVDFLHDVLPQIGAEIIVA